MLFLLSISITLVGAAVLLAFILFSHGEPPPPYAEPHAAPFGGELPREEGRSGDIPQEHPPDNGRSRSGNAETSGQDAAADRSTAAAGQKPESAERKNGSGGSSARPGSEHSIPILRPDTPIPGLGTFELVHFFGNAEFGIIEDERDLEAVSVDGDKPRLQLKGRVALTSKQIIVFDADTVKKIPYGFIEAYRFIDSFLLIKRKNVKKRKTLIKIFGNADDFQYILGALIPL